MAVELKLEPLSADMEYGTIARWLKAEGETVRAGEVVLEVEAEKATQEIEAPVDGTIESVLAAEGDEVAVGSTLAVIAESS